MFGRLDPVAWEYKRAEEALKFLKTTFSPLFYNTPPSIEDSRSSIEKDVTIQCQFTVTSGTPVGEGIPTTSGMLLWLPKRGLGSIYRMGFVPFGAVSHVSAGLGLVGLQINYLRPYWDGNLWPNYDPGSTSIYGAVPPDGFGIINTITYTRGLALPYGVNNQTGNTIQVTPSIGGQIAYSRLYAGVIEVYSSTVSIGNTALAGTFSAASISDTRYIAQSAQGAFSPTNLVQSSETTKDAVLLVPSDQGVVALIGPDIQERFMNPDQENYEISDGNWKIYKDELSSLTVNNLVLGPVSPTYSNNTGAHGFTCPSALPLFNFYITPWSTVATTRVNVNPLNLQNYPPLSGAVTTIQTYPIAETGILKIRVTGTYWIAPAPTQGADFTVGAEISIGAVHIFATANLNGTIQYNTFVDKKTAFNGSQATFAAGINPISLDFDPQLFSNGFTVTGKYIGTLFTVFANPTIGQWTNSGYQNWETCFVNVTNMSVAVVNPNVEIDGNTGPARVIRWDAMSEGMQLDIAGKMWCQVIPQSNLTPYVKAAQMNSMSKTPHSAVRLAKNVYNSAGTELRRIWNLQAYKRFLNSKEADIGKQTIMDWSQIDGGIDEAASASGIFKASRIRERDDY